MEALDRTRALERNRAASSGEKPLGERLVDAGLITENQLDLALREQRRTKGYLGETLVQLGFVTPEAITEVFARENNVPLVDVLNVPIHADALAVLTPEMCRQHKVMPMEIAAGKLRVAFADSFDVVAMDAVERASGLLVEVFAAPEVHVLEAVERNYSRKRSINETIETILSGDDRVGEDGDDTPMVRLVDQLIADAVKREATDIHFQPEEKHLRVRIRVDGIMRQEVMLPNAIQNAVTSRIKLISGLDITEKRAPQDGRMQYTFGSSKVDLRVSTLPTNHGESIVMRVLDSGSMELSLAELGLRAKDLERFQAIIRNPYGMMLVTGPTGSGKTTSLYTALASIDREERSVFTLEDPIEYNLDSVRQCQINPDVGMTFAAGLRSLLRQDPDVILVGEIRDQETAELATRAAMTGHLVFSTLHTNSAVGAIARLVDMGVDRYLLPSALVGVIGQRLLRRLCSSCAETHPGPDPLLLADEFRAMAEKFEQHWVSAGCEKCNHTGYKGRLAVYEVLSIDERYHDAIIAGGSESQLSACAKSSGSTTMFVDGLVKAREGTTTVAEVLRVLR